MLHRLWQITVFAISFSLCNAEKETYSFTLRNSPGHLVQYWSCEKESVLRSTSESTFACSSLGFMEFEQWRLRHEDMVLQKFTVPISNRIVINNKDGNGENAHLSRRFSSSPYSPNWRIFSLSTLSSNSSQIVVYTNLLNEIATVSIFGNCTDREMDIHTVFGDNSVIVSSGVVSVETRSTSLRITTRLDTCTVMYHVDSLLLLTNTTKKSVTHRNDPRLVPICCVFLVEMALLTCITFVLL
ncbi:hypothetical protein WA538_002262, partial [Blastocystis sp. DL]